MTKPDWTDGIVLIGLALASYGAWLEHPPAGFITGGAGLFVLAIFAGLARAPRGKD